MTLIIAIINNPLLHSKSRIKQILPQIIHILGFFLWQTHCPRFCNEMYCGQDTIDNPRGRVCRPRGKGSGEEGILSDVVPVYLYCPAFSVSVSLGV